METNHVQMKSVCAVSLNQSDYLMTSCHSVALSKLIAIESSFLTAVLVLLHTVTAHPYDDKCQCPPNPC